MPASEWVPKLPQMALEINRKDRMESETRLSQGLDGSKAAPSTRGPWKQRVAKHGHQEYRDSKHDGSVGDDCLGVIKPAVTGIGRGHLNRWQAP
jgi:hypothetical protein